MLKIREGKVLVNAFFIERLFQARASLDSNLPPIYGVDSCLYAYSHKYGICRCKANLWKSFRLWIFETQDSVIQN